MPLAPLEAVMSGEVWATVYDQLARLIEEHHTTLVFANTRRMVERVSRHLAERLGERMSRPTTAVSRRKPASMPSSVSRPANSR